MKKLLLILTSFLSINMNRIDAHQPLTSHKTSLKNSSSISQTFQANQNNLNIVSICIRNFDRVLEPLEFSLHVATFSAEPVRSIKFSSGNINNKDCTRLQFEPISDSKGKTFAAQIKRKPSIIHPKDRTLYVESHNDQDYSSGTAYKDTLPLKRDLHFKTYYRQELGTALSQASSQFLQRIGQDKAFFTFYFLLLSTIIFLIFRKK